MRPMLQEEEKGLREYRLRSGVRGVKLRLSLGDHCQTMRVSEKVHVNVMHQYAFV